MEELNPLIRNGIYNALFALANYYADPVFTHHIDWTAQRIPDYWEDPELLPEFERVVSKLYENIHINFESKFLNEQFKIGNIYFNLKTRCLEILGSYDFKEVSGNKHSHRNKISAQLRDEGYKYFDAIGGYIKMD